MEIHEIVEKLIGNITPVGESDKDAEALENLKKMCEVTSELLESIKDVACTLKNDNRGSVKSCCDYAKKFLIDNEINY